LFSCQCHSHLSGRLQCDCVEWLRYELCECDLREDEQASECILARCCCQSTTVTLLKCLRICAVLNNRFICYFLFSCMFSYTLIGSPANDDRTICSFILSFTSCCAGFFHEMDWETCHVCCLPALNIATPTVAPSDYYQELYLCSR
jgi:hypothetical protein